MVTLHHGNVTVGYIQQLLINGINSSNCQSKNFELYAFKFPLIRSCFEHWQ